ncbi:MAG TPA: ImmA/IrrE family metallo-endopeptidase [Pirellulales bacterium]|jgi:Zn-dependent peptidase ImmA (M78 family)|nr:ImmA/IrrE family metallo-endopeptidase [Pirellulales bacterium]
MLPEIAPEEFAATLDRVATDVLDAVTWSEPPVDALEVARRLGLEIAYDSRQPSRARIVSLSGFSDGQPHDSILLRPDPRPERRQWAVAHEVGEHSACQVFTSLGVDPAEAPESARETVANHLAGRLLLPTDWFGPDALACDWDLLRLKQRYATASHELIARRMLDFEPWIVVTIFDNGRLTFRRSNRYRRRPDLSDDERRCWRLITEDGQARSIAGPSCRTSGWPIYEPDWRREILRTCYDEAALEAAWEDDSQSEDFAAAD